MNEESIEDMLDLVDPVMDMVDAAIEEEEEAEFELEAALYEADLFMVDITADDMESVPGFELGLDETELDDDQDPYEGIELF